MTTRIFFSAFSLLAALSVTAAPVHIFTDGTSLLLEATEGSAPQFVYYGARLTPILLTDSFARAPRL